MKAIFIFIKKLYDLSKVKYVYRNYNMKYIMLSYYRAIANQSELGLY